MKKYVELVIKVFTNMIDREIIRENFDDDYVEFILHFDK